MGRRMIKYIFSSRHTRTIDTHNRHRTQFPKVVKEMIKICDIVLEVLDARFIDETRNAEMESIVEEYGKKIVYVINKSDLRDIEDIKKEAEEKKLFPYIVFSSKAALGKGKLIERIKIEAKRALKEKHYNIAHVGVIGYPNTGKSSLINFLTGRSSAGTSAQAGFTKGMQKIRLSKGLLLLDTPGVIPDKENSAINKLDLAKHAKINVQTYDKVKEPVFVISQLMKEHSALLEEYYGIEANGDTEILIEGVGRKKNWLLKGENVDFDKTSRMILKEWQAGKIRK